MPFCTNCGSEVTQGARFCGSCGKEQIVSEEICPKCGKILEENEKFCSTCGASEDTTPNVETQTRPEIKPEVKEPKLTKEGRKIIDAGPKPNQTQAKKQTFPPPATPPQKKKKGCLGCLFKSLLLLVVLFVASVLVIYFATDWLDETNDKQRTEITGKNNTQSENTKFKSAKAVKGKIVKKLVSQKISTDSANVTINASSDLTIILPAGMFDDEKEIEICQMKSFVVPNGKTASSVFDIALEGMHEFDDFVEMQFDAPSGFDPQKHFAQCFSPNGKNWDIVLSFYDPTLKKIRAFTNHFSMFAFTYQTFDLVHDPMMKVTNEAINIWGRLTSTAQAKLLEGYDPGKIMQQQDDDYLAACWNSGLELYGLSATGLSFAENVLDMAELGDINSVVGDLGFGLALINSAMDAQRGNKQKAVLETLKNIYNWGAAKIINTKALNIAFIGVFAIDYSLTAFANEAWAGRKQLYRKVFDNFNYEQRIKEHKRLTWWKKEIYWRMEDAKDPSKFEEIVEKIIQEYIQEFWDNSIDRAIIQAELQGHGWTFNGGVSEKLKDELNQEFRLYILQYIQPLIERMQLNYLLSAKQEQQQNIQEFGNFLNQEYELRCKVETQDEKEAKNYEGFKVDFETVNKEIKKLWNGLLDADAQMKFHCTYAGFTDAGFPPKATLYIPTDKEDVFEEISQSFKVNPKKKTNLIIFQLKELIDGPWEYETIEAKEIYNAINEDLIGNAIGKAMVEMDAKSKEQQKRDTQEYEEKDKKLKKKASEKIKSEYEKSLGMGAVNAPSGKYEKGEEFLYLDKFSPKKQGNIYLFTVVEEDCKTKVILDLKREDYFEAKLFTECEGFITIDYMKAKLKR